MAGFGCSMKQYSDQSKQQQIPTHHRSASQIACRICNQIFNSTQTLITHIESHMSQQNNFLSSSSSSTNHNHPIPNPTTTALTIRGHGSRHQTQPFRPTFYSPMRIRAINDVSDYGRIGASPQVCQGMSAAEINQSNVGLGLSAWAWRQCFPVKQPVAVKGGGDCTMPLLHQLEKRKTGSFGPYHRRSFSDSLDLTLKL